MKSSSRLIGLHALAAVCLLQACAQEVPEAPALSATESGAPDRGIVNITGDLYRAQDVGHFTVFLVTPEGIILADPISRDFATWLQRELDSRFGVPVRYVLYSHSHWDHASGAGVFSDTAELIGHSGMPEEINVAIANLPHMVGVVDSNEDHRLDRSEATGALAARFGELDSNGDEVLSGGEIMVDVVPPAATYATRVTVRLGGKTVELIHPGPSHSPDSTVLLFPEERAVYGVDFVNVNRLAFGFPGTGTLAEWISALRAVEALDFDTVLPGHSGVGTKADFSEYRQYFEDLQAVVSEAFAAGTSLDALLASDALTDYTHMPNYDPQRNTNIAEAYGLLAAGRE